MAAAPRGFPHHPIRSNTLGLPAGRFSSTKENDKTPRHFRVRVMFKDADLKIYPPNDGLLSKLTEAVTGVNTVKDLAEARSVAVSVRRERVR